MSISSKLDKIHSRVKANKWLRYFAIFNRIALAAGFLPSGFVKIMGERFTDLSVNHPMGNYLEALHHTGYYYTFIGILQVTAAILLLIPKTAIIGALLYFPIILNICILSFSVRFSGSIFSAPLMVLANLYLLCWYYDRLKLVLPFNQPEVNNALITSNVVNNKFPIRFFAGVFSTVVIVIFVTTNMYEIQPFDTLKGCKTQSDDSNYPEASEKFCDCIHNQGKPINKCLDEYYESTKQKKDEKRNDN